MVEKIIQEILEDTYGIKRLSPNAEKVKSQIGSSNYSDWEAYMELKYLNDDELDELYMDIVDSSDAEDLSRSEKLNHLSQVLTKFDAKTKYVGEAKPMKKSQLKELVKSTIGEEKEKGIDGKACWKGYKYAGTKNGKDKCVKIKK